MRNIVSTRFSETSAIAQNAIVMAEGHVAFLNRNTGLDLGGDSTGLSIINPDGVMATALNYYTVPTWGWEDGVGYAQYQVETMQGLLHLYKGTGNEKFLDLLLFLLNGYKTKFYNGQPVPTLASIWRANYLINAKDPMVLPGGTAERNQPIETIPSASAFPVASGDSTNMGNFTHTDLQFAELLSMAYELLGVREHQRMYNSVIFTALDFLSNLKDGNAGVNLPYMPGVVPSYLSWSPRLNRKDSWTGTPNTAYQYAPMLAAAGRVAEVANVVELWRDAQNDYQTRTGIDGPFSTIYLWDRPNRPAGAANTFTMSGTSIDNPQTFFAACRTWQVLVEKNLSVPPDLINLCERYATYINDFVNADPNKWAPNSFPSNYSAPTASTNEAAFASLYLSGVVCLLFAGSTLPFLEDLKMNLYRQIDDRYKVLASTHERFYMSGSFTASPGSGIQYSFWTGVILRALGLLTQWELREDPAFIRPIGLARVLLEEDEESFVRAEDETGIVLKEESIKEG